MTSARCKQSRNIGQFVFRRRRKCDHCSKNVFFYKDPEVSEEGMVIYLGLTEGSPYITLCRTCLDKYTLYRLSTYCYILVQGIAQLHCTKRRIDMSIVDILSVVVFLCQEAEKFMLAASGPDKKKIVMDTIQQLVEKLNIKVPAIIMNNLSTVIDVLVFFYNALGAFVHKK